jgi:hypothetical protein
MKISNSQVLSLNKCEKRYDFEHVQTLKPLSYPEPMMRGLMGHDMMEAFFRTMAEGKSYEDCAKAINPLLEEATKTGQTELLNVYRHVLAFGAYAFAEEWKIVLCEEGQHWMVNENIEFVFKPDLVIEFTKGPRRGNQAVLDFKFTGQYWSKREINMYQQVPKYFIYLRKVDPEKWKKLRNGGVVMLNTRAAAAATGLGLFKIEWLNLNKQKLATIEKEHEEYLTRIYAIHRFPGWEPKRTVDSYACKLCFFADDLCPFDLEGKDTSRLLKFGYEINTYFTDNYGANNDSSGTD